MGNPEWWRPLKGQGCVYFTTLHLSGVIRLYWSLYLQNDNGSLYSLKCCFEKDVKKFKFMLPKYNVFLYKDAILSARKLK